MTPDDKKIMARKKIEQLWVQRLRGRTPSRADIKDLWHLFLKHAIIDLVHWQAFKRTNGYYEKQKYDKDLS